MPAPRRRHIFWDRLKQVKRDGSGIMTRVLYVEHNDDNLYMLKTRLELVGGFEVLAAEDSDGIVGMMNRTGIFGGSNF
jgi:hypothetical protein